MCVCYQVNVPTKSDTLGCVCCGDIQRLGFIESDHRGVLVFQTVYAVPILTFAFVCHPAILPMYEELKE